MAISIDWAQQIISVPRGDLTLISAGTGGDRDLYELDTSAFRLELKLLEESETGMAYPDTHVHNTEVTVAGVTFSRFIIIVNGYRVQFEGGPYSVRLAGSNNNIFEQGIIVPNDVSVIPGNSAGLTAPSGDSAADVAQAVWDEPIEGSYTARQLFRVMAAVLAGQLEGAEGLEITIRDISNTKPRLVVTVDQYGNRISYTTLDAD